MAPFDPMVFRPLPDQSGQSGSESYSVFMWLHMVPFRGFFERLRLYSDGAVSFHSGMYGTDSGRHGEWYRRGSDGITVFFHYDGVRASIRRCGHMIQPLPEQLPELFVNVNGAYPTAMVWLYDVGVQEQQPVAMSYNDEMAHFGDFALLDIPRS